MRVRSVCYFIQKLEKNNCKNSGPKNQSEIINEQIADYYFAQKLKEIKKVA